MLTSAKSKTASAAVDRLPIALSAAPKRGRVRTTEFGGLDMGERRAWGIAHMCDLSPRCAPALATRPPRELLLSDQTEGQPHGMAVMDGDLYFAKGTHLYRAPNALDAEGELTVEEIGELSDTDKIMTVFGERLLIFPDKQYVDAADGCLYPMELATGYCRGTKANGNALTLGGNTTWKDYGFSEGDSVHIKDIETRFPEGDYRIQRLDGTTAILSPALTPKSEEGISVIVTLQRRVPDLKGVAVCDNRLFGYDDKNVYIAAKGEAFAWYQDSPDEDGPAILPSYTDGTITACAARGEEMVFFKSSSVIRVTGASPTTFRLSEFCTVGIPPCFSRTLRELQGDLYYLGVDGVYRYGHTAQKPEYLGDLHGDRFASAHAVAYDEGYYISLLGETEGGEPYSARFLYSTDTRAWYAEGGGEMVDGIRLGNDLCSLDSAGNYWLSRSDGKRSGACRTRDTEDAVHSYVSFVPDYSHGMEGYLPISLYLRATARGDGEMRVYGSFANGRISLDAQDPFGKCQDPTSDRVKELACVAADMSDRLLRIPLPLQHCDHMILGLEMIGDWVIHEISLEYETCQN